VTVDPQHGVPIASSAAQELRIAILQELGVDEAPMMSEVRMHPVETR